MKRINMIKIIAASAILVALIAMNAGMATKNVKEDTNLFQLTKSNAIWSEYFFPCGDQVDCRFHPTEKSCQPSFGSVCYCYCG